MIGGWTNARPRKGNRMIKIDEISRVEVAKADYIVAVDPDAPNMSATIWGDDVLGPVPAPGSAGMKMKIIEIECRQNDSETLGKIVDLVHGLQGRVSRLLPNPPRLTKTEWR
jgi:hypothetical protein